MGKDKMVEMMRIIIGNAALQGAKAEELETLCSATSLLMKYFPEPEKKDLDVLIR